MLPYKSSHHTETNQSMMHRTIVRNLLVVSFYLIQVNLQAVDELPLTTVIYAQRNITLYISISNASREPKQWFFWYDPLVVFDSMTDIYQFNAQVRFQFSIASKEFDQIARKTIISLMHPDVGQFALFWIIEPLPIHTLTIYIVDQALFPIPAIYPCTKTQLSGILTFECQFLSSSMMIAHSLTQQILCGKFKFQLEYYIQSPTVPPRLATIHNLHSLREDFALQKYIHQQQEKQLLEKYFIQTHAIDGTIKEAELALLFAAAINTTTRYEVNSIKDVWSLEDLDTIINKNLLHIRINRRWQLRFHLKNMDSPWALKSPGRQTFTMEQIQRMFAEQRKLNIQWLADENRWKVISLTVHFLSDILDSLQLAVINKQYRIDRISATHHRTIDCSDWSATCACQSVTSAIVFISSTQFLRIPSADLNISSTGLTIELWVRPDVLPPGSHPVQLLDFRGQFRLAYRPTGEIMFSLIDSRRENLFTTSLQAIPLNQWTFISCVYSIFESQLQLYVNGEFVSSIILDISPTKATNDIIVGKEFLGAVRNLRLWACARNPDEVLLTMKNTTLLGNERCLTGLWPMADASGQNIADLSLNGVPHAGTLGFDGNPDLYTDPIWSFVLPKPSPPPPPRLLTWQMFRENITFPTAVRWGSIYDFAV